jgi:hypothetical protein
MVDILGLQKYSYGKWIHKQRSSRNFSIGSDKSVRYLNSYFSIERGLQNIWKDAWSIKKPSISDSHWTALSRKKEELSILPKRRTKNFINDYQNTALKDQLEYLKKDIAYHKKSIESHNRQMELILFQLQIKNWLKWKMNLITINLLIIF